MNLEAQAALLTDMVATYEPEYRGNTVFTEGQSSGYGPGFGYIEAQCLHGMLRSLKPGRIIEVGSGVSTHCAAHALALNAAEGRPGTITCIEPNPSAYLKRSGKIKLIDKIVQEVETSAFSTLEADDLLFIDSTHTVKPGGDVSFIYTEVLPILKPGVVVHIHDIYFPFLYQRDVLDSLYQWSESLVLASLLVNNAKLSVMACLSMLHYDNPVALRQVFPEYERAPDNHGLADRKTRGHFPSSIYLRVH